MYTRIMVGISHINSIQAILKEISMQKHSSSTSIYKNILFAQCIQCNVSINNFCLYCPSSFCPNYVQCILRLYSRKEKDRSLPELCTPCHVVAVTNTHIKPFSLIFFHILLSGLQILLRIILKVLESYFL